MPQPQFDLMCKLADFMRRNTGDDTLLIIYYAGHGLVNSKVNPGQLELAGSMSPGQQVPKASVIWNWAGTPPPFLSLFPNIDPTTEPMLQATDAHVLEIFDACYAGDLGQLTVRGGFCPKSFEFIAAASGASTTPGPGETSFTHALIWALKWFHNARNKRPKFTINDLVDKIRECPTFPKDQRPAVFPRNTGRIERIVLTPLPKDRDCIEPQRLKANNNIQSAVKRCHLQLNLIFEQCPRDDHIEVLIELMRQGKVKGLEISRVSWLGLRPDPANEAVRSFEEIWRSRSNSQTPQSIMMSVSTTLNKVKDIITVNVASPHVSISSGTVQDETPPDSAQDAREISERSVSYHLGMIMKHCGAVTSSEKGIMTQRVALCSVPLIVLGLLFIVKWRPFR